MLVTDASVGRVLGGAQIVQEKNRESFLLSKNVCWCWLRMLLLAEYAPATMLDPQALGTAFQKNKNKRSEWNCTSSPSLNNAADYKGGGVASPQASWIFGTARIMRAWHGNIWHGTDPPDPGTARHGTSLIQVDKQLREVPFWSNLPFQPVQKSNGTSQMPACSASNVGG